MSLNLINWDYNCLFTYVQPRNQPVPVDSLEGNQTAIEAPNPVSDASDSEFLIEMNKPTLGCLMLDPIRYILIKEMMYLIGSRLRDFPGMCHPHLCQVQSPIWSIPNIPNIPEIVW